MRGMGFYPVPSIRRDLSPGARLLILFTYRTVFFLKDRPPRSEKWKVRLATHRTGLISGCLKRQVIETREFSKVFVSGDLAFAHWLFCFTGMEKDQLAMQTWLRLFWAELRKVGPVAEELTIRSPLLRPADGSCWLRARNCRSIRPRSERLSWPRGRSGTAAPSPCWPLRTPMASPSSARTDRRAESDPRR